MTISTYVQLDTRLLDDEKEIEMFIELTKLRIARLYLKAFEVSDRIINICTFVVNNSSQTKGRSKIQEEKLRESIVKVLAGSFDTGRLRFYFLEAYSTKPRIISVPANSIEKTGESKSPSSTVRLRVDYTFPVADRGTVEYAITSQVKKGDDLLGFTCAEFYKAIRPLKK